MISRKDFVFTIGYDGGTAVVDGSLKRRYGSLSTAELAEQGLYKQALCSAVFEDRAEAVSRVLELYNERAEHRLAHVEELKRMFGVFEVPQGITRILVVG
jgi:hypothetical protein